MKRSDSISEIIKQMSNGDIEAILYGAKDDLPILNLNSILFAAQYQIKSEEFNYILKNQFAKSDIKFMGIPMSCFAIAALDIMGLEKYTGDDYVILDYIRSKFIF